MTKAIWRLKMVEETIPFMNIAPGEVIREELELRNWQQDELAESTGYRVHVVEGDVQRGGDSR